MAINFPDNPTVGDTYTVEPVTWTWNGATWQSQGVSQGAATNDFILDIGGTSNNTFDLGQSFPAGGYAITVATGDTTYDVYLLASNGSSVGYSNSASIVASDEFNKVVVLGLVSSSEKLTFTYSGPSTTADSAGAEVGAGAYISSVSPTYIPSINGTTTVTGGNFASNVQVFFEKTGTSLEAKSVTRNSASQLTVTRPDNLTNWPEVWTIRVVNPGVTQPTGSNIHKFSPVYGQVAQPTSLNYYVLSGGGGGSASSNPGGGGGGGGQALTGTWTSAALNTNYTVTIGAGGAKTAAGTSSVFGSFTANPGQPGSGGTGGASGAGFAGFGHTDAGGGGGGAGAAATSKDGGIGVQDISPTPILRGGGGGGGGIINQSNAGAGTHGGGAGGQVNAATPATVNYGAGGGGGGTSGGAAGSTGIVILKYADTFSPISNIGAGLTYTESTTGGFRYYTFTAGTGSISWSTP